MAQAWIPLTDIGAKLTAINEYRNKLTQNIPRPWNMDATALGNSSLDVDNYLGNHICGIRNGLADVTTVSGPGFTAFWKMQARVMIYDFVDDDPNTQADEFITMSDPNTYRPLMRSPIKIRYNRQDPFDRNLYCYAVNNFGDVEFDNYLTTTYPDQTIVQGGGLPDIIPLPINPIIPINPQNPAPIYPLIPQPAYQTMAGRLAEDILGIINNSLSTTPITQCLLRQPRVVQPIQPLLTAPQAAIDAYMATTNVIFSNNRSKPQVRYVLPTNAIFQQYEFHANVRNPGNTAFASRNLQEVMRDYLFNYYWQPTELRSLLIKTRNMIQTGNCYWVDPQVLRDGAADLLQVNLFNQAFLRFFQNIINVYSQFLLTGNSDPTPLLVGIIHQLSDRTTNLGRFSCDAIPIVGFPSRNGVNTTDSILLYIQQRALSSCRITEMPNNNALYCSLLNILNDSFVLHPTIQGRIGIYGSSGNTIDEPSVFDNLTIFQIVVLACALVM